MKSRKIIPFLLDNMVWILLVVVVILFSTLQPLYFSKQAMFNILVRAAVFGILVIGESFCLITANFDLSIQSTLAFCAMMGAWLTVPKGSPTNGAGTEWNHWLAIAILMALGGFIGWANGNLITRLKMNNFVVTLAMLITFRGLMHLLPAGNTVYNTTMPYNILGQAKVGGIPLPIIVLFVAFIIAHIVLTYTPFGRSLYAIGGNREAARASGINPEKRIRQVYLIAGLLAALAGWMLGGRIASVPPNLAEGYVFEVMAAAVIGGVSLFGGRGNMIGALGGVLLMSAILTGLNMIEISAFWIDTTRGLIILLAMLLDAQKVRYVSAVDVISTTPVAPTAEPAQN